MSWATKPYTFSPSTVIESSQMNETIDDLVDQLEVAMPSGGIILWSGSVVSIPAGWYICDGANGTPDLRGRVVVGAGSGSGLTTRAVGDIGGAESHSHTYSGTTSTQGANHQVGSSNDEDSVTTHSHTYSGTTSTTSSMMPFRVLAYIMKS